ncbi:MAG: hydrogenase iron-sulfur subunit [Deltaproteobacteria bacterium]|nr:hydrogenase iron-sulfur subunit [Deltaproteobacteria bacterium]
MESQFEPHIVSFCCHNCTSCAEDNLESIRKENSITIELRKLPCTGKVEIIYLLKAFEEGADIVYVVGCLEGTCHYLEGNIRTKRRVKFTKKILDEIGIGGNRVHMYNLDPSDSEAFGKTIGEMKERIEKLGPSPLKLKSK